VTDATTAPFSLSVVTATEGYATKRLIPDARGLPVKDPQRGLWIASGTLERVELHGLADFAALLPTLTKKQALVHGVSRDGSGGQVYILVTAERYTGAPGTITRTLEHLDWPTGPHLLLLDYDPAPRPKPR
jgi:hypothetical protein